MKTRKLKGLVGKKIRKTGVFRKGSKFLIGNRMRVKIRRVEKK